MSLDYSKQLEKFCRYEAAKIKAVITKHFGLQNIEIVEDIVQDAVMAALESWPKEIPENPTGWLMEVAKKKSVDYLRRKTLYEKKVLPHLHQNFLDTHVEFDLEDINDSLLRTIFYCCHPLLQKESQICLALKILCGFSVSEIASCLVTTEVTINKRLYRAKQKFRSENISFEVPAHALEQRLETVYITLYLLFNEGYYSSHSSEFIRMELCEEAIRLTRLLLDIFEETSQTHGLLALMLFQTSRFSSRLDEQGGIVILEEQNRNLWNQEYITRGMFHLQQATQSNTICSYILKAGIAAEHCLATSFSNTNWSSVCHQYELLLHIENTPIIQLNLAIAEYFNNQKNEAFLRLHDIESTLINYSLLSATLGELYFRENKSPLAKKYFKQALKITTSNTQKTLLNKRIKMC